MISKEQNSTSSGTEAQNKQENQQPSKPLTEKEKFQKLKEDYFKEFSAKDDFDMQCTSTGCTAMYNEVNKEGNLITKTDYFVDKDSIRPFVPNKEEYHSVYTANTIANVKNYSNATNEKVTGKMYLYIDNHTGIGNANTHNDNASQYDLYYEDIDFTKEKFESNNVYPVKGGEATGKIEGHLSGETNSTGKFNAKVKGSEDFEIEGIFNGKDKDLDMCAFGC